MGKCKKVFRKIFEMNTILLSVISLGFAIVISGIIMALCGYNPFEAFGAMFVGAFGSQRAIAQTLTQATPLIFTGLAFTFAKKATLINLGIEGQLQMGAMAAAIVGAIDLGLPMALHLPLALVAGMIAGGLYAGFVGFLKVKFGSNEVIATIMLNSIAIYFVSYLANYPLKVEGAVAQTSKVMETAMLPRIFSKYQLTLAIFIAIAACILVKYFMQKTRLGYEMRCVGMNSTAAETAGIKIGKIIMIA
ncbi:MAG: ABC transporter permease, partial [Niameybacter sp.]